MSQATISLTNARQAGGSTALSNLKFAGVIARFGKWIVYTLALICVLPLLPAVLMIHLIAFLDSSNK